MSHKSWIGCKTKTHVGLSPTTVASSYGGSSLQSRPTVLGFNSAVWLNLVLILHVATNTPVLTLACHSQKCYTNNLILDVCSKSRLLASGCVIIWAPQRDWLCHRRAHSTEHSGHRNGPICGKKVITLPHVEVDLTFVALVGAKKPQRVTANIVRHLFVVNTALRNYVQQNTCPNLSAQTSSAPHVLPKWTRAYIAVKDARRVQKSITSSRLGFLVCECIID